MILPKVTPNVRYYISSKAWLSLSFDGIEQVGGLEKAILGFTIESYVEENRVEFSHTVSYDQLKHLVFEYMRVNSRQFPIRMQFKNFISKNIELLSKRLKERELHQQAEIKSMIKYL